VDFNQVAWAQVAMNSFHCIRGIPDSISSGNNTWPEHMPLRMSRINRTPLVDWKPVRKKNNNNVDFKTFDILHWHAQYQL
jgi:hypothetical protein